VLEFISHKKELQDDDCMINCSLPDVSTVNSSCVMYVASVRRLDAAILPSISQGGYNSITPEGRISCFWLLVLPFAARLCEAFCRPIAADAPVPPLSPGAREHG
jgi:hypothetical protein